MPNYLTDPHLAKPGPDCEGVCPVTGIPRQLCVWGCVWPLVVCSNWGTIVIPFICHTGSFMLYIETAIQTNWQCCPGPSCSSSWEGNWKGRCPDMEGQGWRSNASGQSGVVTHMLFVWLASIRSATVMYPVTGTTSAVCCCKPPQLPESPHKCGQQVRHTCNSSVALAEI